MFCGGGIAEEGKGCREKLYCVEVGLSFVFFGGGIAGGREGVTGEIVGKLYFVEVGLVCLFCGSGIAGGREGVTPGRKGKRPGRRYGGGKKERNLIRTVQIQIQIQIDFESQLRIDKQLASTNIL